MPFLFDFIFRNKCYLLEKKQISSNAQKNEKFSNRSRVSVTKMFDTFSNYRSFHSIFSINSKSNCSMIIVLPAKFPPKK